MKRKTNKLIIGIIFLAGLSLLLYPFVANQWNNYRQKQLISSYEQTVSEKDAAHEIDYDAELQKAEAYNEALLPSILPDSFAVAAASDKEDQSYMDALNIAGDEMVLAGCIRRLYFFPIEQLNIPKLFVCNAHYSYLPVFW